VKPSRDFGFAELRGGSDQGSALTGPTDASVLTDDVVVGDAWKAGFFGVSVEAADDGSGNETYTLALIGRNSDDEAYSDLGTVTITRGRETLYIGDVAEYKKQINFRIAFGGTTPSLTCGVFAVATQLRYAAPDAVVPATYQDLDS
jgi:hypothetical protein